MAQLFTNDARSKLTGPITSTSLSLLIDPTDQARFPVATGGDWFKIKLEDASGNIEYVRVQRASGSSTLTVASTGERGYEEPTKFPAAPWSAGATVELIATAADLQASLAHPSVSTDAHDASAISFTPAGSIAATEVQAAIEELDGNFASYLRNTAGSWINDADGAARLFFTNTGATIVRGYGAAPFSVQNAGGSTVLQVSSTGVLTTGADALASGDLTRLGQVLEGIKQAVPPGSPGHFYDTVAPAGWVEARSDNTIGSAASGATRANADTADLYAKVWAVTSNVITTSTGAATTRGASAAADFAANKRLALPELRSTFIRALDNGRGIDVGRTLGSEQLDQFEDHVHGPSGFDFMTQAGAIFYPGGAGGNMGTAHTTGGAASGKAGSETRPRNIALLACWKL